MAKKILITGSNGFLAHHMVNYFADKDYIVFANIRGSRKRMFNSRVITTCFSLEDEVYPNLPLFDYVVHTAARTQVDESLDNVIPFVSDNLLGTATLFEWVKRHQSQAKVCLFSSDEVLGPAKEGEYFDEDAPYNPSNPYAATKASQELLLDSFVHSFNLNMFTVRCMNVIGEGESETKFIGKTMKSIRENKKIVLHGKNRFDVASRHWIDVLDVARIVEGLLEKAEKKQKYHIAGKEIDVYTLATILFKHITNRVMSEEDVEFLDYHSARKGHDKRYSLSSKKIEGMGLYNITPISQVIERMSK